MKDKFPGYCKKSQNDIENLWNVGNVFFDTNVLLNLYRYSKETRNTIIELIGKFKNRIWLPHQAALEYNRNRYEVISAQEKAYTDFTEKISQIQKDLQSTSKPPFLSKDVHESLNSVFKQVSGEVNDSIESFKSYFDDDPIYESVSKLFDKRITEPFDEKQLVEIEKEGETRFANKVPPGYEDAKKKEDRRKYGDLILWKQVIQKAKELKKPVILITDERKEDWWWKIKDGRNMGPRQELVEEMKKFGSVDFHMYSSERFLSFGQKYLKEQVNKKALEEIQAMKKAELEGMLRQREQELVEREKRIFRSSENLERVVSKSEDIKHRIRELDRQLEVLEPDTGDDIGAPKVYRQLRSERRYLEYQLGEMRAHHRENDILLRERYERDKEVFKRRRFKSDQDDNDIEKN